MMRRRSIEDGKEVIVDEGPFFNKQSPTTVRINEWADSIGSLSVLSALIFGFSLNILTTTSIDNADIPSSLVTAFYSVLSLAVGLSFIGLAVSSIMFHNIKGIQAWNLHKHIHVYERKTYAIKNIGNYAVYLSWAMLVTSLALYCWITLNSFTAVLCTAGLIVPLIIGIYMGGLLSNLYASFSGDGHILNILEPSHVDSYIRSATLHAVENGVVLQAAKARDNESESTGLSAVEEEDVLDA